MSSIGNDIIALKTTDAARTQTPRFYTKILSPAEQQLYKHCCASISFHYYVWQLWSIKESAYKCLQRHQPELVFSPVKIQITDITSPKSSQQTFNGVIEGSGFTEAQCFISTIQYDAHKLFARSVIYGDELIHSVALIQDDFSKVGWGIKWIDKSDTETQSATVREFLRSRLATDHPALNVKVEKSQWGYPFITSQNKEIAIPVTLSHHHHYVGYAFIAPTFLP